MSDSVTVTAGFSALCHDCVRGPDGWPVRWCARHEPPQVEAARYRRALEMIAAHGDSGEAVLARRVLAGGDPDVQELPT